MAFFPLVERELRAAARQPLTYSLRCIAALALLAVLAIYTASQAIGPGNGGPLFAALHRGLLASIWLFTPFLTADTISREKREGTLALLSLASVGAREIALAKAFAGGLRAFSLWLATLPLMAVPMLMGGVTGHDLVFAASLHFSSLCLATGAGLLASSWSRIFTRALGMTLLMGFVMFLCLELIMAVALLGLVPMMANQLNLDLAEMAWGVFLFVTNQNEVWAQMRLGPQFQTYAPAVLVTLSVLVLVLMVMLAGSAIQRSWGHGVPSLVWQRLEARFCQPLVMRNFLRAWMQRSLARNPIGWLEHRTWSSRLVMWSWLAVISSVYSMIVTENVMFYRGFGVIQSTLAWMIGATMAMTAAGSFRRERETGVLELLLVSPLREMQIIGGRVKSLWVQFAPTLALWTVTWLWVGRWVFSELEQAQAWWAVGSWLVGFATLPVVGLYFSLNSRSFVTAALYTLILGLVLPQVFGWMLPAMLWRLLGLLPPGELGWVAAPAWQLAQAWILGGKLHRDLQQRRFKASREV